MGLAKGSPEVAGAGIASPVLGLRFWPVRACRNVGENGGDGGHLAGGGEDGGFVADDVAVDAIGKFHFPFRNNNLAGGKDFLVVPGNDVGFGFLM